MTYLDFHKKAFVKASHKWILGKSNINKVRNKMLSWIRTCSCGKLIVMNKYMILFYIYYFSNLVAVE